MRSLKKIPLRIPNDCRELAEVVAREHGNIHPQPGIWGGCRAAFAGALRRHPQAGSLCRGVAGLRVRCARPPGPARRTRIRNARGCSKPCTPRYGLLLIR